LLNSNDEISFLSDGDTLEIGSWVFT